MDDQELSTYKPETTSQPKIAFTQPRNAFTKPLDELSASQKINYMKYAPNVKESATNLLKKEVKVEGTLGSIIKNFLISTIPILLLLCIVFLIYGATSVAIYDKIPDGSEECKKVFDVKTQNTLLSIGSVGTFIFGSLYLKYITFANKKLDGNDKKTV